MTDFRTMITDQLGNRKNRPVDNRAMRRGRKIRRIPKQMHFDSNKQLIHSLLFNKIKA